MESLTLTPIGVVHTDFHDRAETPRQPYVSDGARGTIELFEGKNYESALIDLDTWSHIWVLFWFHANTSWRPMVLPPRSPGRRRGVFSTRSPHRPNPLGLSVLSLDSVHGRVLHVRGVDILDGTPVLDIKPYVPAADCVPTATMGWLAETTEAPKTIVWSPAADLRAAWLLTHHHVNLYTPVARVLSLGAHRHGYRRIQIIDGQLRLAIKDWRVFFNNDTPTIEVTDVRSGYRPAALLPGGDAPEVHHAFVTHFASVHPV